MKHYVVASSYDKFEYWKKKLRLPIDAVYLYNEIQLRGVDFSTINIYLVSNYWDSTGYCNIAFQEAIKYKLFRSVTREGQLIMATTCPECSQQFLSDGSNNICPACDEKLEDELRPYRGDK